MPWEGTDQVLVLLAPGFEETDIATMTAALRRAGLPVALVGLMAGPIRGRYGLLIAPDTLLHEVEGNRPRAIVLPGGAQSAHLLGTDPRVHALLQEAAHEGAYVLAIDAAYSVLLRTGVLPWKGDPPPVPPGIGWPGHICPSRQIWIDGRVIFCRDSGASLEAALTLVASLEQANRPAP